ncbi:MAG TPA: serine/threonine-protein kinase [Terriglobales bacterium]|nr:serine/threonine-protein kinase [Terriglobales bacterium]
MTTLHQSLGRYLIEAEIGRGAMGVVYRAYDPQIGRSVAIKTISLNSPDFTDKEEYRGRFLREARAAGRLSHPGIVTIFDAGEDPETGEPYLVMEHVTGQPLSKMLNRTRKLPLATALQFAHEIAEALDYAHTQGVIHRDIKPSNILITEDNHAKIADFGVAWLSHEMGQNGEVVGSPAYMAPEQMSGKQADARSDLFSLGVVLYTMITGFRPFQGNSAKTVVFKVMNIEPVPVTSLQSDIPPELNAIVSRAIAKNPDERYPSGAALARALRAFGENDSALSEATEFFARSVQGGEPKRAASEPNPVAKIYRRFSLTVALLAIVVAGSLFAWRMTKIHDVPLSEEVIAQLRSNPVRKVQSSTTKVISAISTPVAHQLRRVRKKHVASPAVAPVETILPSKVQVEIQHHFGHAHASIWLDDNLVLDQDLRGSDEKHLLRAVEVEQVTNAQFAAGKHSIQVRVVSGHYDQIETIDANLAPGSEHVLSVRCEKHKLQVTLQ